MTTVYAVAAGSYSDYHIEGVYSTRERAQQYIDYCASSEHHYSEMSIEEYQLDQHTDALSRGQKYFRVHIFVSGEIMEVEQTEPRSYDVRPFTEPREIGGREPHLLFCFWADDAEHAIKQANDMRAAWITSGRSRLVPPFEIRGPQNQ